MEELEPFGHGGGQVFALAGVILTFSLDLLDFGRADHAYNFQLGRLSRRSAAPRRPSDWRGART